MKVDRPVRATELAEFVYCERSWWLRIVQKKEPDGESGRRMTQGQNWHERQAAQIFHQDIEGRAGTALIVLALLLLLAWLIGLSR